MNYVRRILFLFVLLCGVSAYAQSEGIGKKALKELKQYVKQLEKDSVMQRASWSLVVKDLKTGRTVYEKNPQLLLAGASTTKLITTGAGLKYLGEDFKYKTRLEYVGQVQDSTLYGTLYIVGGGDPTLGSGYKEFNTSADTVFAQWKNALNAAGIARIEGRVVADDRYFAFEEAVSSWSWDDVSQTFGTGVRGLAFYDNLMRIYISAAPQAGAAPVVDSTYPSHPHLKVINHATTTEDGSRRLNIVNSPLHPGEYTISGRIPVGRTSRITMPNRGAGLSLAGDFVKYLSRGTDTASNVEYVLWDSNTKIEEEQGDRVLLCEYLSPALSEIASVTNKYSDNMYAETILRTIGKVSGADDTDSALEKEYQILDSIAPGADVLILQDGSGLSRNASLNAAYYVDFLYGMSRTEVFDAFLQSLAVPGGAGTFRNTLKDVPTRTRLYLKSGSLYVARATSGYAGQGEDMLCFCVIVNRFYSSSAVSKRINGMLEILSKY